ncbi:PAS domain S-box protein [Azohydromonas sp.]|uniref:PAS domain S-box protein n=1 Tax=Azohydromonas sp. TaxID=1872666 RepID=UPI002B62E0DA|nr:PAS domain S-box protein [Azohydromonas sp.]HMM84054.1 PAS domain S-box protein [Azohydromonas sp.]
MTRSERAPQPPTADGDRLDAATFQRQKYDDFRRTSALAGVAGAVLVSTLWVWDWAVDAAHAPDTLGLRLLLSASILVYPAALALGVRRGLSLVFYAMLLWLQWVYHAILARLDGGAVHGLAGYMYWFIVPPLMSFVLPLAHNVAGNLAVVAFPLAMTMLLGAPPALDVPRYLALIVPAGAITIAGHVMIDRLMRRIYEAQWQLQRRARTIDALGQDKRRADDALRKSEEQYRLLVEHASEGILISQRGVLRFVNPRIVELAGRPAPELLGRNLLDFVHPDEHATLTDLYRRRRAGSTLPVHAEFRVVRPDGGVVWVETSGVDVEWEGQRAVLSFLIDITQRHALEESLKHTLEERETVLDRSMVGIAFLDPQGRLRWANPALGRIFGTDTDALVGRSLEPFYASRDSYLATGAAVTAAVRAGQGYETELTMRRSDGGSFWAHLSGKAVNARDLSRGTVWAVMDIDTRKRAEQEIRSAFEKHKELGELKSRFVSMTSHEFRTPLATILSSTDLLEHYAERLPAAERAELLATIRQAVQRMTRLLDDVLLIGKAEAGRLAFRPVEVDLCALCRSAAMEAERAAPRAAATHDAGTRAHVVLDLPAGELRVRADDKLLRFILGNLLSNALKYSPAGGDVVLTLRADAQALSIAVADRGIGIPPEDLPRLFEPFHRGRNVGTLPGTGLGLAIVRKAVDLHGGRIEVDSAPGATRFVVTLPRHEAWPAS